MSEPNDGTPVVGADRLRQAMARFPTGVTITTTLDKAGEPQGFTAGSLVSVSLDPPLISVCVAYGANCYQAFADCDSFAVSVLRHDQGELARTFASKGADKFAADGLTTSAGGLPVVEGAVVALECDVHGRHAAGDHVILVGLVRAVDLADGDQLLFADRLFSRLSRS
ncbi:flavin reductase family protein [Saccharopolyspora oryzae]|uniref:Flavin reductase family protein n=1 Tax=Saccharopolyspora oryzae TaxID=2997343 RepID=A0ABT4USM9_9PSEU|nr:flavin reductase family protein [Saccharopolyspora oryzae]MDA3624718.1 flavin reductase family protein [Saccharopolyspora oryzae]